MPLFTFLTEPLLTEIILNKINFSLFQIFLKCIFSLPDTLFRNALPLAQQEHSRRSDLSVLARGEQQVRSPVVCGNNMMEFL